jgi:hypothetical protein
MPRTIRDFLDDLTLRGMLAEDRRCHFEEHQEELFSCDVCCSPMGVEKWPVYTCNPSPGRSLSACHELATYMQLTFGTWGMCKQCYQELAGEANPLHELKDVHGCPNFIDAGDPGSYCREHQVSFITTRQILMDFRDSTNYLDWKIRWDESMPKGWDILGTYTTMDDLGQCQGVNIKDGRLYGLDVGAFHLTGVLPASFATLDTLVELSLEANDLHGVLPAHIGSASCLPSLKILRVAGNPNLSGVIDAHFLAKCTLLTTQGCHSMETPFISGASLSSADIGSIYGFGPKAVVAEERAQGKVVKIDITHPDYSAFTAHLPDSLAKNQSSWCLWQQTWVSELRKLKKGYLFVFITESFESKFKSRKYTEGEQDERKGVFKSGEEWCAVQDFDLGFALDAEGWGFEKGKKATSVLDYERMHLEAVSKKHGLPTAFIALECGEISAMQIPKPAWYPYEGIQATLGTFVYQKHEAGIEHEDRLLFNPEAPCPPGRSQGGGGLSRYLCPITGEIMQDPVVDPEGNSYERTAIEEWLSPWENGHNRDDSPVTGTFLCESFLQPNIALKDMIQAHQTNTSAKGPGNRGCCAVS